MAIVHALRIWRCYLEGGPHPVQVFTDHQPSLTYLPTKGMLGDRQIRWAQFLTRFDLEWNHRPGVQSVADLLSRMPCLRATAVTILLCVVTRRQAKQANEAETQPVSSPITQMHRGKGATMTGRGSGSPTTQMQRGKGTPCVSLPDRQDDLAGSDGSGAGLAGANSDLEINIVTDWDISSRAEQADFLESV